MSSEYFTRTSLYLVFGTSVHRLRNGLLKNSDLKVYTALFVYNLVIGYLKAFDKKKEKPGLKSNQVLGTVLQCSYFSVFFFSVPS